MPARPRLRVWIDRLRGGGIGAVLARGASLFLVVQVAGVAVSFALQVLLARAMGAEAYGTYVYVYSWLLVLLLLCRAGLGTASLRFVSALSAQQDWPGLRGYLRLSQTAVLVASLLVAASTALVVKALEGRLPEALRQTFWVACLAMPLFAFLQVWSHALRGFKRVLASQIPGSLLQPALLGGLAAGTVLLVPEAIDAPRAMWLTLTSGAMSAAVAGVLLLRSVPEPARSVSPRLEPWAWGRVAAPLLLYNALFVLQQRTDILLIGSLLGPTEAGVYAVASRVANVIPLGLTAVSAWAAPLISDLHARGDRAGLQRLVRFAARGTFAFTLPACVGVVWLSDPILRLFGEEFVRAQTVLALLVASQVVNALVGPVGFLLTMTGRQGLAARILGAHVVLLAVLIGWLIPRLGIEGAALATAVNRISWNLTMAWAVWRTMRLRATLV